MTTTMCAKRGTPATFVFVGDADGLDDGLIGDADGLADGLIGDTVAAAVVVLLDGVAGADDTRVDDPAPDASADDARVDEDAAGDDVAAGSWLPSAEAGELCGCELVHPDITRATATATDQRATLALTITSHSRSGGRSARCRPQPIQARPD
jgi:hypothetical protein